jgi:hypothetical protein
MASLSFKQAAGLEKKGLFLVDDTTKSLSDGLSGRAIEGSFKGKKLEPVPMTPSFWFGWVDHYRSTELYLLGK